MQDLAVLAFATALCVWSFWKERQVYRRRMGIKWPT